MADKRRIFVVDDHPVFREGLVRVLNQEKDLIVCGEAEDASGTLKAISDAKPDLVIVDISLDGMNGIDLAKSLRVQMPSLKLLVLSMHPESLHAERALRAGANGYVMKKEPGRTLLGAVRQVLEGKTYVSPELNERLLQGLAGGAPTPASPVGTLSNRELEVFRLIGQGVGTRQIADSLSMSMKTVESHRQHIKEKLQLSSTTELVQRAIHWIHREENN